MRKFFEGFNSIKIAFMDWRSLINAKTSLSVCYSKDMMYFYINWWHVCNH